MLYQFDSDQRDFAKSLTERVASKDYVRAIYDGQDGSGTEELWFDLAEMGVAGLGIDVGDIGSGGEVTDLVLAAETLGRHVAPVPLVGVAAAAAVLARAGTLEALELLGGLVEGRTTCGLVVDGVEDSSRQAEFTAESADDQWLLTGTAEAVVDVKEQGGLVVLVDASDRPLLLLTAHAVVTPQPCIDRTRPLGRVVADRAPATVLAEGEEAVSIARLGLRIARLLLAAEGVGAAAEALERTRRYTLQREQFGLPIGTFQAVKHRLADMLVTVENARSAVYAAAWAVLAGAAEQDVYVSAAKAVAAEGAVSVAGDAVQLHGGIGVTWESDLHFFLRRAKLVEHLLGDPAHHLDIVARHLLAAPFEGADR
jgi:alkylation response protein AidB-like acyl-CoA dehydrogenase